MHSVAATHTLYRGGRRPEAAAARVRTSLRGCAAVQRQGRCHHGDCPSD